MAGQEQEQDRSEPATPFKLQEARRRGQVPRSMEFSAWVMLAAAVMLAWTMFPDIASETLSLMRALLDQSGSIDVTVPGMERLAGAIIERLFSIFGVLLLLIVLAAALASFVQVGPVFSGHQLKPDFSRLNPATGFKRLFNVRLVYEALKTIVKVALITGVAYFVLRAMLPALSALAATDVRAHPAALQSHALHLALTLLAVLGLIAAFDFAYSRWDFAKKMRMSRRELREEVKRRDGDPKIKAKIRELQREAARRGASLKRVPEANVLITNPTHLSVALKYERGKSPAPCVIAKGSGEMALRMRELARRSGVPTLENRPLARLLFRTVPLEGAVPPETYAEVARVLTWAYRLKRRAA